ncbi:MAG: 7-carboxy-7-deazaguanine synthase QueE [Candidatus Heimdallarchaeota archaeon]|nr:7-carboxy-7-deazaguanine synthase QueE [Candidatus Heimdallarchaeota archaeon]
MNINEIFESFQGEGPSIGVPSIFVRFSGCNLRCVYCDTKYTWLFSEKTLVQIQESIPLELMDKLGTTVYSKQEEIQPMELDQLVAKIISFQATNIVITGGEPLLQSKNIISLLNHVDLQDYKFEIETNGTMSPIDRSLLSNQVQLRYNVSPKLSNSYNDYKDRIKVNVLNDLNSENSIFKFVITNNKEISEIREIIEEVNISPSRVYLMPEAISQSELLKIGKKVAEIALKNNFNYSHRLHIEFYGDERGV